MDNSPFEKRRLSDEFNGSQRLRGKGLKKGPQLFDTKLSQIRILLYQRVVNED